MFQQQSVKMRLTPQLRKAITILQLSTPELLEVVQQEMDENPVLEFAPVQERAAEFSTYRSTSKRDSDAPYDLLNHAASNEISLERHLKEQLMFMPKIPQTLRRIVVFMIGNLDANGYLRPSLSEISDALKVEGELAEQAISLLQSFEPTGVGARNLRECLLLQVQSLAESFPLVAVLIRHHLKDVAGYHVHKLSQRLQASPQEIQAAMDVIKGVNPRPGAAFHTEAVHYIMPEIVIEQSGERLAVHTHQASLPRLSMNGYYERIAREGRDTNEAARFLAGKIQSAMFFLRCLEQRRKTIFRVAQAIADEQSEFFWRGTAHLKPMTLKHIADKLGMHESTVSRATAGKYAQTPWGIFELKHFFPSGLPNQSGEAASSERVKSRLKEWVRSENPAKPYSDHKLAALLMQEGIQISRRTVAKYREELGISSSQRRKRI
ncbi:RNA polymerase factor sigma-54 [Paenibacillus planticolens]|nr:RNA polymerase factor sigma-54 [Paenibacillus planticolens]